MKAIRTRVKPRKRVQKMADNDEKVEKTEEKIDPGKLPDPIGDDEEEPVPGGD